MHECEERIENIIKDNPITMMNACIYSDGSFEMIIKAKDRDELHDLIACVSEAVEKY